MATINLKPHNEASSTWYLVWAELDEVIAQVTEGEDHLFHIAPRGPHFNPMKSFASQAFANPEGARQEVQLYFYDR